MRVLNLKTISILKIASMPNAGYGLLWAKIIRGKHRNRGGGAIVFIALPQVGYGHALYCKISHLS